MAWRKVNRDDIVATLSQRELDAFSGSSDFSADPVDILARRAAALVRDYLRTNGNVRMSPDEEEIPEATISPAMDYLAIDILKRLNLEPSDVRKEARRDAKDYFNRIADGRITPESYGADATSTSGGPGCEVVQTSRIRASGDRLEGL